MKLGDQKLEQIVGEIEDEYDVRTFEPVLEEAPVLELDGTTNIRDLEMRYGIEIPVDAGFETLAGFLLQQMGEIPEAGDTIVVSTRTDKALIVAADALGRYVCVDRRTPWGNPFRMPRDGDRDAVVAPYRDHLAQRPDLLARLDTLRGMALGCWCAPERCHGDVLVEALRELRR